MLKIIKKIASAVTAAMMLSAMASAVPAGAAETDVIFDDECENLELDGLDVWTSIYDKQLPGYSGEGFVYLTGGTMRFEVTAPEDGMYEINTRYVQILDQGSRMQTISINGAENMVDFPYADTWTDKSFGIFRLNKGVNTIELLTKYGYAAFDTITVKKRSCRS